MSPPKSKKGIQLYVISLFMMLFFSGVVSSQTVRWSQPMLDNNKFQYLKIIGSDGDGFFVLRSNISLNSVRDRSGFKNRKYLMQYFGNDLNLRWEEELLSPLEGGKITDIQVMGDKAMVLFYTRDKTTKQFNFYSQFLNTSGKWLSQPVLLDAFSTEEFDEENKPGILLCHDQSKFALSYRKFQKDREIQSFMVVVADQNLSVLYKKEIIVPMTIRHFVPVTSVLSDSGNFFVLGIKYTTEKKVKAPGESYYQLIGYNKNEDRTIDKEVKIQDKFLTDVAISSDNYNHKIVVAGFYSDKTTYSTAGIFTCSFTEDSLSDQQVLSSPFAASFLQKFVGDKKENKNKELVNYSIDRLVLRRDGGVAVIAESYYETSRTYWDYYTQTVTSHYYYHFGNIMILSVNPDGKILWSNVFSKDQNSTDDAGYYSSYASAISGGKIIALYNKYADEESSVLYSTVDGLGNQKTDVLFNEVEKVSVIARSARQIDEETLIVPAFKENKFYMVSITNQ
ncbi:MAG: hypothetical protein IPF81_01830 [Bacteroidetes bacterium]|nr:hypothetical protein [Bacteroidota bacterium]